MPATQYPDTAKGAIAYLKADSSLDLSSATARPDPQVYGVWLVDLNVENPALYAEVEAIVYLAGYADPMGDVRRFNDFECCCHDPSYQSSELMNCLM